MIILDYIPTIYQVLICMGLSKNKNDRFMIMEHISTIDNTFKFRIYVKSVQSPDVVFSIGCSKSVFIFCESSLSILTNENF